MANLNLTNRSRRDLAARREYENPLTSFQNEMNRLFENFFNDSLSLGDLRWVGEFAPRVDVVESGTELTVTAELPGLEAKDIQVSLEAGALVLSGEKRTEHEENAKGYQRLERSFGSFERVIPLSTEVDESKVEAQFKNGVLTVTLPKTPEAVKNAKKIEIKPS